MKNYKLKHLSFSLFDFDIWICREWEFSISIFQFGPNSHLFSFSAGKNYKTCLEILFVNILYG